MTVRQRSGIGLALAMISALLTGISGQPLGQKFAVTDLGTLGGDRSSAFGVNDVGQIVGISTTADGATRGFIYEQGTRFAMGTFGGRDSMAYAISELGTVTGRAQDESGTFRAFVGQRSTELIDLTALHSAPDAPFSTGTDVNARGEVVGYRQQHTEHMAARTRGFLFSDANVVDLGTFGGEHAVVTAINDVGDLVGFYSTETHADYSKRRAFLFRLGAVAVDLGTLGGALTIATAINNLGRIVGFAQRRNGNSEAFVYQLGRLNPLGTLPGGRQSFAYGLNDAGDAVGASEAADGSLHATLYRQGSVIDLNSAIPSGSGWRLTEARDINTLGVIVGTGVFRGQQRAFRLTPVAP